MTSLPTPPKMESEPRRPRISSCPSLPSSLSLLSVPKSGPPLGQPGRSFVVKRSPHFWKGRVPWHRASSEAVASGEHVCSFLVASVGSCSFLKVTELVPAQPTPRRSTAKPIRKVPTTATRCLWRTTAHPPSLTCVPCY